MKTLVDREDLIFNPPQPGCIFYVPGLPGGASKIYDRSPYGNNGTIMGATWVRLPSGLWYLSFDGQDDYVDCGMSDALNFTSEDFTIKAWIKCDNFAVENAIFQKGAWISEGYFFQVTTSRRLDFYTIQAGPARQRTFGDQNVQANTWHHCVASRSGVSVKLYLDTGEDIKTAGTHLDPDPTDQPARIGLRDDGGNDMAGCIALLEVWNRAWTTLDVEKSFDREKHLFGVW